MRPAGKLLAAAVLAAAMVAPGLAADVERGRTIAVERQCMACHGADGRSEIPNTPSLAGMPDQVLVLQLIIMREGVRVVAAMAPFASGLTDRQIVDLAAFFASLPPGPATDRGPPDATKMAVGAALAERSRCGVCHLPDFRGRDHMGRLAGQRQDYLLHAMMQYRDNQRVGADTQMSGLLYGMSDTDLEALAHFMAQQ